MSVAWTAYRVAAPCLGALAPAIRWFASPEERALWAERLGAVSTPAGVHAWIHGASMGEALAVTSLARGLAEAQPGALFHLTASTRNGRARLRQMDANASLAPLDAPQAVRRFFTGVKPARLFVLETEVWPHWLLRAAAEGVPVAVISARLSPRSVPGYRRLGSGLGRLVARMAAVLCQTRDDADRWLAIGARPERTAVIGNLKSDALPGPVEDRVAARSALGLEGRRPLLVLGSVRPREIRVLAQAWRALPQGIRELWQVAALPRHPQASAELQQEASRAGQTLVQDVPRGGAWRWDDRIGVLQAYYAAADVAFVGGTLAPYGGHNPLEPAARGAAVITGRHFQSQAQAVSALLEHHAIWVAASATELSEALATLLSDPRARAQRSAAGLEAVQGLRGASRRAVDQLVEWKLWPAD